MNFKIKSERLILMPPTLGDVARIVSLVGEQDVAWMLGRVPFPYTIKDAKSWVQKVADDAQSGEEFAFGIYLSGVGLIGSCGLMKRKNCWEIGYWIGKPYWEQGFATEAGRALLDWAEREIPTDSFISGHIYDNASSGRVLKKLGFEVVGENRMYVLARDSEVRAVRYALNAPAEAALCVYGH